MNKTLLALAMGAVFATPSVSMAAGPVLYGKFNIALDQVKDEIGIDTKSTKGTWLFRDNNNSSRIGVKGDLDTGADELKVFYQLEYGIDPSGDENSGTNKEGKTIERAFSERNIFAGVGGGFGNVKFGKFDTVVKEIGGKVDQFNDTIGDITNLMVGETRNSNLLQYTSPKIAGGLELVVAIQPGEGRTSNKDAAAKDTGLADSTYAALMYGSDSFDAAVAMANNEVNDVKFDGTTKGINIMRATGQYKVSGFEIGALYQTASGINQIGGATTGADAKETSVLASLGYKLESWKLKAQYGVTEGKTTKVKRNQMAVGADYKLTKNATTQLYYVNYTDKDRTVSGITDPKTTAYGVDLVFGF